MNVKTLEAHLQKEKDEVQRLLRQVKFLRRAVQDVAGIAAFDLADIQADQMMCGCEKPDYAVNIPGYVCALHLSLQYCAEMMEMIE